MAVRIAILFCLCGLFGCTHTPRIETRAVETGAVDARYVDSWDLEQFPGDVVCGSRERNGFEPWGDDRQTFIILGESVDKVPSERDWKIYCSRDPRAQFYRMLGIDPASDADWYLSQIHRDMKELGIALERYREDLGDYPVTEEGLQVLTVSIGSGGVGEDGSASYIPHIPVDPWGKPYIYEYEKMGGVAMKYRLLTRGEDGARGGKGVNADIDTRYMEYLDHLDRL